MCTLLTPVLTLLYIVKIEVYLQCFTESISLRANGKPTSRGAEISSPSSLYFKAVKGKLWSALTGATSELTNSSLKKNSLKTHYSLLRKKLRNSLYDLLIFLHLRLRKKGNTTPTKTQSKR